MHKYLFLAFLSLPFHVSATSSPYRGGEVSIERLCCTNLLKADFTKSYQIQGTTWV